MPRPPQFLDRIELLQGTLDLLILETLGWGPQHGYGISTLIQASSKNVLQVDTGSLYPALHRLERQGLIDAEWVTSERKQRVRTYRLTAAGRCQRVAERKRWARLTEAIAGVLSPLREGAV